MTVYQQRNTDGLYIHGVFDGVCLGMSIAVIFLWFVPPLLSTPIPIELKTCRLIIEIVGLGFMATRTFVYLWQQDVAP